MVTDEVCDVFVSPFLEIFGISVFAFRINPHIETFSHDHHSERIANIHLHGRWHVVSRSYGVASHFLHGFYLPDESGFVFCSTEWSEVVVKAYTFNFSCYSIELESTFFCYANRTNADIMCFFVKRLTV